MVDVFKRGTFNVNVSSGRCLWLCWLENNCLFRVDGCAQAFTRRGPACLWLDIKGVLWSVSTGIAIASYSAYISQRQTYNGCCFHLCIGFSAPLVEQLFAYNASYMCRHTTRYISDICVSPLGLAIEDMKY